MTENPTHENTAHWRKSIQITLLLLFIWFTSSFGFGILWRDWADQTLPPVGNAPFGFWMAQQGSILVFVGLLAVYSLCMNKLDRAHATSNTKG